jgi:hypothetical protein
VRHYQNIQLFVGLGRRIGAVAQIRGFGLHDKDLPAPHEFNGFNGD